MPDVCQQALSAAPRTPEASTISGALTWLFAIAWKDLPDLIRAKRPSASSSRGRRDHPATSGKSGPSRPS